MTTGLNLEIIKGIIYFSLYAKVMDAFIIFFYFKDEMKHICRMKEPAEKKRKKKKTCIVLTVIIPAL